MPEIMNAVDNRQHKPITQEDIRSDEMVEIIGKMPHWVLRWGITVIACLCLLIIAFAYFFKYPEITPAHVTITYDNAPVILVSKNTSTIQHLFVKNNEYVLKNQAICLLSTTANYEDVRQMETIIAKLDTTLNLQYTMNTTVLPPEAHLGELQSEYASLYETLNTYKHSFQQYLTAASPRRTPAYPGNSNQFQSIKDQIRKFRYQLMKWKEDHVLISPADGTVSFFKQWNESESVSAGENIITFFPKIKGSLNIQGIVAMENYFKVKTGQLVLLKLQAFPYQEFGILEAHVTSKTLLMKDHTYIVEMQLNKGFITQTGKAIPASTLLEANAEIITDNKSILSRLFEKVIGRSSL